MNAGQLERLAEVGCLLHPDPNIAPYTWPRRWHDQRGYSLCGVSHTMSSATLKPVSSGACDGRSPATLRRRLSSAQLGGTRLTV